MNWQLVVRGGLQIARQTRESMVGRHRPALIVLGYAMLTYINLGRKILADASHSVEANWRESDAIALEQRVTAITDWLDHTEDLISMLNGDNKVVTDLRMVSGILRSRKNDFNAQAAALRTELENEG